MAAMAAQLPDGLSILMPVYNEIERIERALDATLAVNLPCPFELVLVDDGSTDGTVDYLKNRKLPDNVRVIFHERNQGKGAAVRTALADARLRFSAIFDADLEYEPDDLAVEEVRLDRTLPPLHALPGRSAGPRPSGQRGGPGPVPEVGGVVLLGDDR